MAPWTIRGCTRSLLLLIAHAGGKATILGVTIFCVSPFACLAKSNKSRHNNLLCAGRNVSLCSQTLLSAVNSFCCYLRACGLACCRQARQPLQ